MRTKTEVETVLALVSVGLGDCEIARRTGIPRATIRDWRHGKIPTPDTRRRGECEVVHGTFENLDRVAYAYLLGQYLGDGTISTHALACLFPQHGPGRKHERPITLAGWQHEIVSQCPEQFIRGLIHSDGCRHSNPITAKSGRQYTYVRYAFTNHSDDIRRLFCDTCDLLGIHWTIMNRWTISIARRADIERLDQFVGPKR